MSFQSGLQNVLDTFHLFTISSTAVISWKQLRKGISLFVKYLVTMFKLGFFRNAQYWPCFTLSQADWSLVP